jgi:hypothetical protein
MKKILTLFIFLFLISGISFGQPTKIDSILFDMINKYRVENGVHELIWNDTLWKASNHYSTWCSKVNFRPKELGIIFKTNPHREYIDVPNFKEIYSPSDRASHFLGRKVSCGENFTVSQRRKNNSDELVAQRAFIGWVKSEPHRDFLLSTKIKYASCSVVQSEFIDMGNDVGNWERESMNFCTFSGMK